MKLTNECMVAIHMAMHIDVDCHCSTHEKIKNGLIITEYDMIHER